MRAKDVKSGTTVKWSSASVDNPAQTLIGDLFHLVNPNSGEDTTVLLYFGKPNTYCHWPINDNPKWRKIIPAKYKYAWCLNWDTEVEVVAGQSFVSSLGMHCASKFCNEFNKYAAPNQPDGKTYYCYTCKSKPSWAR
jgi:hypothetical protein